jgi:hypothetical protein
MLERTQKLARIKWEKDGENRLILRATGVDSLSREPFEAAFLLIKVNSGSDLPQAAGL